jgi:hypothetical protein
LGLQTQAPSWLGFLWFLTGLRTALDGFIHPFEKSLSQMVPDVKGYSSQQAKDERFLQARALLLCDAGPQGPAWPLADVAEALGVTPRTSEHLNFVGLGVPVHHAAQGFGAPLGFDAGQMIL